MAFSIARARVRVRSVVLEHHAHNGDIAFLHCIPQGLDAAGAKGVVVKFRLGADLAARCWHGWGTLLTQPSRPPRRGRIVVPPAIAFLSAHAVVTIVLVMRCQPRAAKCTPLAKRTPRDAATKHQVRTKTESSWGLWEDPDEGGVLAGRSEAVLPRLLEAFPRRHRVIVFDGFAQSRREGGAHGCKKHRVGGHSLA